MSGANVQTIRSLWEPLKGVDATQIDWEADVIRQLIQVYSPDVELRWEASWAGEREYRGRDGVIEAFSAWVEPFSEYYVEALDYVEIGDRVAMPTRQTGTGRASGAGVEIEVTHLFEFRDGMISRVDEYATLDEALEAARRREAG
jgi:ketosteroid isomerase-like protein